MLKYHANLVCLFCLLLVLQSSTCSEVSKDTPIRKEDILTQKRHAMVDTQLAGRDITSKDVLSAMRTVPRHLFVPSNLQEQAYADWPLPIGQDQTISQPYIVAYMTEALAVSKGDKVLEIGTGSGYQAAVLAQMGVDVYTIEIIPELGRQAASILSKLGYNVHTRIGDGYAGWPEKAPFHGITVTAAPKTIPEPLKKQLKSGGRLVIPVGEDFQTLNVLEKRNKQLVTIKTLPVRFVPMTGQSQNSPKTRPETTK